MTYSKPIVVVNDTFSEMISASSGEYAENDTSVSIEWSFKEEQDNTSHWATTYSISFDGDVSLKDLPLKITMTLDQAPQNAYGPNGPVNINGNVVDIEHWANGGFDITFVCETSGVQVTGAFIE